MEYVYEGGMESRQGSFVTCDGVGQWARIGARMGCVRECEVPGVKLRLVREKLTEVTAAAAASHAD